MKRLLTSLVVLLGSLLTTFAQYSGSGNGTEEDPYLIFNENQLSQMVNFLDQEGVVFKLMKDLNLSSWITENNPSQGWIPVGVESSPFKGKFLGNNHMISGLSIKRSTEDNVGFFGYLDSAIIQDLTVEGTVVSGKNYVGGIAGQSVSSTINNVSITLTGSTGLTGQENVGGFVGKATSSTITSCSTTIVGSGVTGSNNVGGFAGYVGSSAFNGFDANTAVNATTLAGGMIGRIFSGTYQNGNAEGDITVTQGSAGGFAGNAISSYEITNIKIVGNIQSAASGCVVGGMIGTTYISGGTAKLTNCAIIGNLSAQEIGYYDAGALGGTIGIIQGNVSVITLNACFSKGKLNHNGDYTGGIIGKSEGGIANMESCSHFGDISGWNYVGGLIGAMLNVDVEPSLSTYTVYRGRNGNSPSGILDKTIKETIVNGTEKMVSINNCTAIGNIDGKSRVGGLIGSDYLSFGYSHDVERTGSFSSGYNKYLFKDDVYTGTYVTSSTQTLSFTYYDYARNFVSHSLTNNYYSGTIHGTNYVGGLVGLKEGGELKNNYAYANIYGDKNVGGIVGSTTAQTTLSSYSVTTIKSNVANCQTISATTSKLGRVYGSIAGDFYTTIGALGSAEGNRGLAQTKLILQGVVQEIEDNLQQGTSIGPSLLRLKATYVSLGWNFDENWNILETECFPYKKYQAAPPVIESDLVSQATSISGKSIDGGTVYLYYKDREAVSTQCNGHQWTFSTEALQSGAQVQIYADVEGMTPSYFTTTTVGYPGSGTESDPWRIYTAEDLQGACNRGYYKVMNDIDLTQWINENSPTKGWIAVGRNSGEATYIDGDGHKVSGLWIEAPDENFTGLFSNFSAGQIKNLNVEVATGKKVRGADYTGILIGRNANGRLVNCSVKGQVEGTGHVGGVVGYAEATTISSITFDGGVKSTAGNAFIGGMAGQMLNCTVTSCNAAATIEANSNSVGGLTGQSKGGTISKSTANTTLTASGVDSYVGGLVGYSETPITQCIASGNVTATGDNSYTGGLVGYTKSSISNSYSTAKTTGTWFTGGLVGYSFSSIDKCYAKGDVYGSVYGGGVVGELDGPNATLTNSVACNNILSLSAQSSWGSRVIGGYKNGAPNPDESNYALSTMQVSLNNVPQNKTDDIVEGQARTAQQLMQAATYQGVGWDFSMVWGIDEGKMYPYLLWEIGITPVADVSFDKTTLLIAVGKTETITANVLPLGATNKQLKWTSSNTAVATVADGVVTAVAIGNATITATSTDGSNISATCQVTVMANNDAAIAALQDIVDRAQALYDNSTEGENIGEYAVGSRAQLLAVINSVKDRISSTMSNEAIAQCTNEINAAIELFQSKMITTVEDTDISQIDNVIYIEPMEEICGTQATISLKMKNTAAIRGFQFDLYLPEGVTVVKSSKGKIQGFLSEGRLPDEDEHTLTFSEQPDGAIRFLCSSQYDETFTGNDGEIATLRVNIAEAMTDGDYPLLLKNIKLTESDISKYYETPLVKCRLTIKTYMLGDINADGVVDVSDYTGVANHIHGNTPEGFVIKAGDVDGSGIIDVSDYTGIANIIHTGSIYGNSGNGAPAMMRGVWRSVTDMSTLENVIYVEPFTVSAGQQTTVSLKMKNTAEIRGFQFDLYLPEGVTVVKSAKGRIQGALNANRLPDEDEHDLTFSEQPDGAIRVLCSSQYEETFTGNDGELVTLQVTVAADMTEGKYPIVLKNVKLTENDISKFYETAVMESEVTVAPEYILGDANGDGVVNVSDVTAVINKILGKDPQPFNEAAADVKADGIIDVSDVTAIINIILGKW